jgi:hypothetical protein
MTYLNLLVPNFLHRIDNYLMLHSPHVWRTRIHFVGFYALIVGIVLFLIGLMYPLSMYDISRTPYEVEELKHTSFLFLLICGFFSLVYWWQQVVKFRILTAKWYHSFLECLLFFIGIFTLWQAVNAFKNGIDTNIAYRVGRNLSKEDKVKLYEHNFFLPGLLHYDSDDQFRDDANKFAKPDSLPNAYFKEGERLLSVYSNRIHRKGVILDSQFYNKKDFFMRDIQGSNSRYGYRYSNYNTYREWYDSINIKVKKYIKPKWTYFQPYYSEGFKWSLLPFQSRDAFVLDSVYNLFSAYDKYQVDSVRSLAVNSKVEYARKQQDYDLIGIFQSFRSSDIVKVLDTCSHVFFNNQQETYLDLLRFENQKFELNFRRKQLYTVFTSQDSASYKKYLTEIMLMMPINHRSYLNTMEVGLFYKRDSLTNDFFSKITPRSKKIYTDLIGFYINNIQKKESAAEIAGNYRWNKQTGKYAEIEKYPTKGLLDTIFYYTDSILSKKNNTILSFEKCCDILNSGTLSFIFNGVEDWKSDKDSFLIEEEYRRINRKPVYAIVKKMRRDSIPLDTVFKWQTDEKISYSYRPNTVDDITDGSSYKYYKQYRNTQISNQDSTFLDGVYNRNGYIQDKSEHNRLFFHANAYYLWMADIQINKSRGFLRGWNPFYLSTNNKLALIILSFLMFFTSLAQSNLFTAAFVAFFINFVNNTFFNIGQNLQEVDKNKQAFWLFGLLAVLAIVTALNVWFRKFKLPIINLLINIQLFALLGIFIWLFDSQTIEQQRNYAYLSIIFWLSMVWQYRAYLALPSKK